MCYYAVCVIVRYIMRNEHLAKFILCECVNRRSGQYAPSLSIRQRIGAHESAECVVLLTPVYFHKRVRKGKKLFGTLTITCNFLFILGKIIPAIGLVAFDSFAGNGGLSRYP